jgi:hypothetical protein
MFRGALVLTLMALCVCACASSELTEVDATDVDADVDAPTDAGIDAIDACVEMSEICNGRDEDCDSNIDEDFPTLGSPCTAGSGACMASGVFECDGEGAGVRCSAMPGNGGNETCNGINDDCDATTDEGFGLTNPCDGNDSDMCAEGQIACAATGGGTICTDTTPNSVETCNGMNDDCDGATDEGFGLGALCDGADTDNCREGMIVCAAAGGGTTCSDTSNNSVETCNAMDDDCDMATDEGFNLGTSCDGPGDTDACPEGQFVCNGSGGATCMDTTSSTVESCNGVDDDCRNGIDDGFAVGTACSTGVGACNRPGMNICNGAGNGVVCNATAGSPTAETCGDGVDQDCNGADVACPTNDLPSGATNISGGGTFTVDLVAAHDDDANATSGCGSTGGRDVFYQLSLASPEVVYLDTFGSSFDTVIRVYSGTCAARTGTPTCDDDAGVCTGVQSQLATQLAAGTWCVVVDQFSSLQTTGALTLSVVRGGRTGTSIAAANGSQAGTTTGLTNVTTGGCQSNSTAPDRAYFFTVCPATTMTVGANTCTTTTWDSVVYLRKGAASAGDVACSDDVAGCGPSGLASSFTGAQAVGPGLFWLTVDGYLTYNGAYTLTYTIN